MREKCLRTNQFEVIKYINYILFTPKAVVLNFLHISEKNLTRWWVFTVKPTEHEKTRTDKNRQATVRHHFELQETDDVSDPVPQPDSTYIVPS